MIKGKRKLPQLSFCNCKCVWLISGAVRRGDRASVGGFGGRGRFERALQGREKGAQVICSRPEREDFEVVFNSSKRLFLVPRVRERVRVRVVRGNLGPFNNPMHPHHFPLRWDLNP